MHNTDVSAMFAYYIRNIEDASDRQYLDRYFCRAGEYLCATQEAGALPAEQVQALIAVFDHLYQQGLIRLQARGTDSISSSAD